MKAAAGASSTQRFVDLLGMETAPATFKASFDLYLDCVSCPALAIFNDLVAVGKANEQRLGTHHLKWAEAQTKNMIRSNVHLIRIWVRNVCDKRPNESKGDIEERLLWLKWQALMLLTMRPSRDQPYDRAQEWAREDIESSSSLLDAFACIMYYASNGC
jgi:hypothetical protein